MKCSGLLLFLTVAITSHAERPNILFIYTDDQGAWTIGAAGNPQAHTPNIDRIYNEGVVFKNAFVHSPVCSPARATLLTSRHGSEQMILDWIRPGQENWLGCNPALPTWPRALKKAGYKTALIGKWHLGIPDTFHPSNFGYDHFMGHRAGGWAANNPTLEKNGKPQKFKGLTEDILATETIDFITRHQKDRWLVSLHFRAPHTAWLPVGPEDDDPHHATFPNFNVPHRDLTAFNHDKFQKSTRDYYSSVTCVDRNVGRVMTTLRQLNLEEKTLIIFTSDHGYNVGQYGLWSKGNAQKQFIPHGPQRYVNFKPVQRPNLYDTSIRVPCALQWKGTIAGGRTLEDFVFNSDWFATLCESADIPLPSEIRGNSFWPQVMGKTPRHSVHHWYGEWDMRQGAYVQMRAIRTSKYKLIIDFLNEDDRGNRRAELYHLERDPEELHNLFNHPEHREIQRHLMNLMVREMHAVDPPTSDRHTININFASQSRYDLLPPGKTAGIHGTGIWNNFNQGLAGKREQIHDLIDSKGQFTGTSLRCQAGVMISNAKKQQKPLTDANELMMQGWAGFNAADQEQLTISNLPESFVKNGYDVFIYCDSDALGSAARTMKFTVDDRTEICKEPATNFSAGDRFVANRNYVRFNNLQLPAFAIEAQADIGRAAINALQIVKRAND